MAEIMLVIPISFTQCERGSSQFSAQGRIQLRIKSDVRSSLHVSTTEDIIRISMEGPEFVKWFNSGQRSRRPNFAYRMWPDELTRSLIHGNHLISTDRVMLY